jgi:hypothetical protein
LGEVLGFGIDVDVALVWFWSRVWNWRNEIFPAKRIKDG